MADTHHAPVVVIGLGRFGTAIALELERQGTEVLAIDRVNRTVQDLSSQLTHAVTADCTDMEALRQLGVGDFRRAVVAIGDHLEDSILVTSLLVDLEVRDIWAKATSATTAASSSGSGRTTWCSPSRTWASGWPTSSRATCSTT